MRGRGVNVLAIAAGVVGALPWQIRSKAAREWRVRPTSNNNTESSCQYELHVFQRRIPNYVWFSRIHARIKEASSSPPLRFTPKRVGCETTTIVTKLQEHTSAVSSAD